MLLTQRTDAQKALAKAIWEKSPNLQDEALALHTVSREYARALVREQHHEAYRKFSIIRLASGTSRSSWSILNRMLQPVRVGLPKIMKDLAGLILPDIASSASIWHTFRAQIGSDHIKSDKFDTNYLHDLNKKVGDLQAAGDPPQAFSEALYNVNKDPITLTQLQSALKSCPNGSTAGLDMIHYEAYKFGGEPLLQCLTDILQVAWSSEIHPSQWDKALVAPLFKGGPDPNDVSKYRAILLQVEKYFKSCDKTPPYWPPRQGLSQTSRLMSQ